MLVAVVARTNACPDPARRRRAHQKLSHKVRANLGRSQGRDAARSDWASIAGEQTYRSRAGDFARDRSVGAAALRSPKAGDTILRTEANTVNLGIFRFILEKRTKVLMGPASTSDVDGMEPTMTLAQSQHRVDPILDDRAPESMMLSIPPYTESAFPEATESPRVHFHSIFDNKSLEMLDVDASTRLFDYADASFDAVTCFGKLGHAMDARAVLVEMRRIMKPGAILAISLPRTAPGKELDDETVREYCPEDLDALLIRAGFTPNHWISERDILYVIAYREETWGTIMLNAANALQLGDTRGTIFEIMHADVMSMPGAVQRELALLTCETLATQNKIDEAVQLAETANEIDPGSARVVVALGSLALLLNDNETAAEAFREATRRAPDCYTAWLGLALASESANDIAGACIAIEAAQSMAQGDKRVVDTFARLARLAGDDNVAKQAISIYTRLKG